ncbi:hypothetical protein LRM35_21885 [Klebsiella variicola subsp. variicola]|nr:hypothetical protein LRM35_21885 [Klebsiella variicola subsp. variicola]
MSKTSLSGKLNAGGFFSDGIQYSLGDFSTDELSGTSMVSCTKRKIHACFRGVAGD